MSCQSICEMYGNASIVAALLGGIALNSVASLLLKRTTNPLLVAICKWLQAPHPDIK